MKKAILIFVFMIIAIPSISQPSLEVVRNLYLKAADNENACTKLINKLEPHVQENPLYLGYKGIGVMMMANHVFNPFKKWDYFQKGKAMLKKAIKNKEKSAELRFLRLAAQIHTPAFLGYDDHINNDKKKLIYILSNTNNTALKNYLIPLINELEKLSVSLNIHAKD